MIISNRKRGIQYIYVDDEKTSKKSKSDSNNDSYENKSEDSSSEKDEEIYEVETPTKYEEKSSTEFEEDDSDEDSDDDSSEDDEYLTEEQMEEHLKEEDEEAYISLQLVKKELEKTEPSIIRILKDPMKIEDRARLVQLYEIYKNTEPNTEEWLFSRDIVNRHHSNYKKDFLQYQLYTQEEHKEMAEKSEKLSVSNTKFSMKFKILNLVTSEKNKEIIYGKFNEFTGMKPNEDEYGKMKSWITWAIEIPHDKLKIFPFESNEISRFLKMASVRFNEELYGMENVKEQLLIYLNAKLHNPNMKKCNLGLVGPPGVGKTVISRLLASVMDYPFEQISFGGVSSPEFLKGHEYTYVGAQPGEIVKCLKKMKYKNGILFLDEYEKIADNRKVSSALLHITDPSQNMDFRDNYLSEITIDLSNIWFIYSMNSLPQDSALKDRIFSIEVPGYSFNEKVSIVEKYLIPKALKNTGMEEGSISMNKNTIKHLINEVCSSTDKGVRAIEKAIADIINKINFIYYNQDESGTLAEFNVSFDIGQKLEYPIVIDNKMLRKLISFKHVNESFNMMYL